MNGGLAQRMRVVKRMLEEVPEHTPTYTLNKQLDQARKEMSEERWLQLLAEQAEYDRRADAAWQAFKQHGDRHRYRKDLADAWKGIG